MDLPANFKFDVRVRPRLLAKGQLTDAEVEKHLEALADAQPHADVIDLPQPALTTPEERERAAAQRPSVVAARPVASAPGPLERSAPVSIAPAPAPVDQGWDEDDDEDDVDDDEDDDDDDDDEEDLADLKPAAAAAPSPAVQASPPAPPSAGEADEGNDDKVRGEEEE